MNCMIRIITHILILSLINVWISCTQENEVDALLVLMDKLGYDRNKCLLILHESSCLSCIKKAVQIINNLDSEKIQLIYVRRNELSDPVFDIRIKHVSVSEREFYKISKIRSIRSLALIHGVIQEIRVDNIIYLDRLLQDCYNSTRK